jgi:hypothetical protein
MANDGQLSLDKPMARIFSFVPIGIAYLSTTSLVFTKSHTTVTLHYG